MAEICAGYAFLAGLLFLFIHLWWHKREECEVLKKKLGKRLGDIRVRGDD